MRQHEQQANVGILFMRATTLEVEGKAACHKAELLGDTAYTFEVTIGRSEMELDAEIAKPFLPGAREELDKVREMQRLALDEANAKLSEAKAILDRLRIENDLEDWPAMIH